MTRVLWAVAVLALAVTGAQALASGPDDDLVHACAEPFGDGSGPTAGRLHVNTPTPAVRTAGPPLPGHARVCPAPRAPRA
jgi:hypothetical protein